MYKYIQNYNKYINIIFILYVIEKVILYNVILVHHNDDHYILKYNYYDYNINIILS